MTAASSTQAAPEEIQARVSGSSFYAAMLLMPKAERQAMFAVYRFCRLVDDVADDGTRPRPERAIELVRWRADIAALYAGRPSGQAAFLGPIVRDFNLREADFLTVIDGMDMDVAADIRAPAGETLDLYCERVASAVGRLSTRIFGMDDGPGFELAREPQRHAEIVVQLGVIGPKRQQSQVGLDRLVEPAGTMRLRGQPELLHEAISLEERNGVGRGFPAQRIDRRRVVHDFEDYIKYKA